VLQPGMGPLTLYSYQAIESEKRELLEEIERLQQRANRNTR